jgi:hypothetical protein
LALWAAHALTWAAGVWFAAWPVYRGTSATPSSGGGSGTVTHYTETLIEANGWPAMIALLIPILLTGLALVLVYATSRWRLVRKTMLWMLAVVLLGFCAVAILSIGFFYIPAALALLVGIILNPTKAAIGLDED